MKKKVKAWDFGAAKGTGASVVDYDPGANLVRKTIDLQVRPVEPRPLSKSPRDRSPDELLRTLNVNRVGVLKAAYRLATYKPHRAIPKELRQATAAYMRAIGANEHMVEEVLAGLRDDHLQELL